ncbi:major capsid protein (plasmid) [Fructilactobacillus ixorae]|uniref:Major capsid protein n=1 Tax=Fructilactobacillus ixorae TaxID=1750535 RepID=A0ABY5C6E7_9LACO|nr:major capsid protein [Fructilactobacillus ixorae]USS94001.1 major capsid protein [Fructilactobacillus ixorae]
MQDIFSDITTANIASYWTTLTQNEAPFIGETLFPSVKQGSRDVTWYKGETAAASPLKASGYNAQTVDRDRQGFSERVTRTKFFKEGQKIDEQLRQQLLTVQNSPIPAQRDAILQHVFDDTTNLLRGASLIREITRMQVLRTGKFEIKSNGQDYKEDFEMNPSHIKSATKSWKDDGSPLDDFDNAISTITNDSGITPTRVLLNRNTFNVLVRNEEVKATILANNANTSAAAVPRSVVTGYMASEYGLTFQVYDKTYRDVDGTMKKFIPDGEVILIPDGDLGKTVFSPTPEETDLMASSNADVSIVDTGVAISNTVLNDPVTKRTKVSQQFTPTFEMIDGVYVLKAFPSNS